MSEESSQNWLTVSEVAERLSLSKMTVYRMISSKEIPAHKFGRMFRVKPKDLEEYIANSAI